MMFFRYSSSHDLTHQLVLQFAFANARCVPLENMGHPCSSESTIKSCFAIRDDAIDHNFRDWIDAICECMQVTYSFLTFKVLAHFIYRWDMEKG